MKIASLDLGSNSFLLLISEVIDGKFTKVLHDEQRVTRLAQGVHTSKRLHPEALARAEECFQAYAEVIKKHSPDKVIAVSTSAARDATNQAEFIQLGQKYGIPISIIAGQKEAELTYKGTIISPQLDGVAVLDIGGGSTEVIASQNGEIKGYSINIGSVRLSEIFSGKSQFEHSDIEKVDRHILSVLEEKKSVLPNFKNVVAVAGTPTTLSCLIQGIDFDVDKIEEERITFDQIKHYQEKISLMSLDERKKLKGLPPKRADVLPYGLSILKNFCSYFGVKDIQVSTRGVRYGLALEESSLKN